MKKTLLAAVMALLPLFASAATVRVKPAVYLQNDGQWTGDPKTPPLIGYTLNGGSYDQAFAVMGPDIRSLRVTVEEYIPNHNFKTTTRVDPKTIKGLAGAFIARGPGQKAGLNKLQVTVRASKDGPEVWKKTMPYYMCGVQFPVFSTNLYYLSVVDLVSGKGKREKRETVEYNTYRAEPNFYFGPVAVSAGTLRTQYPDGAATDEVEVARKADGKFVSLKKTGQGSFSVPKGVKEVWIRPRPQSPGRPMLRFVGSLDSKFFQKGEIFVSENSWPASEKVGVDKAGVRFGKSFWSTKKPRGTENWERLFYWPISARAETRFHRTVIHDKARGREIVDQAPFTVGWIIDPKGLGSTAVQGPWSRIQLQGSGEDLKKKHSFVITAREPGKLSSYAPVWKIDPPLAPSDFVKDSKGFKMQVRTGGMAEYGAGEGKSVFRLRDGKAEKLETRLRSREVEVRLNDLRGEFYLGDS